MTGGQPLPPRLLELWLRRSLSETLGAPASVRVIRVEGRRALVEVSHLSATVARHTFSGELPGAPLPGLALATRRTWGTLRLAKLWLRPSRPALPGASRAPVRAGAS